jgi:hypothetical protein
MEPTGAEVQTILERIAAGIGSLQGRADATDQRLDALQERVATGFDSLHGRADATDRRLDSLEHHLSTRIDDVVALVITVKEAAELQSARIDGLGERLGAVDQRLTARTDSLERRMEHGFARVDGRFDALTTEMRSGFAVVHDGLAEVRGRLERIEGKRRRGPKRGG